MKTRFSNQIKILLYTAFLVTGQLNAKNITLHISDPMASWKPKEQYVTQITVKGVINQKTIQTIMLLYPNVSSLNLLNTKVLKYTDYEKINYPENEIPKGAFMKNKTLKEIILPGGVVKIGKSAFWACTNLEKVVLPNSLLVIDQFAFQHCEKLNKITFPVSLVSIGGASFGSCKSLKTIVCMSKIPPVMPDWNPFSHIDTNDCLFYVPGDSINEYIDSHFSKMFSIKVL